ncbi:hypothetical protein Halhy_1714 [Haliscomenobacter hydrossis DSM 1100]|uniref:Uncharacterized protein n=1 Tax=Haliscomenobacter hydrossis (strain ATCC 27775 / DSM 1100 / LMG 10767 / O) TaxID=760192 RepID=F4L1U4_HALH1|nr:hypothetical protein Halhy_1714 [Haliscomenobacter hydrossis DSM 1100]
MVGLHNLIQIQYLCLEINEKIKRLQTTNQDLPT